MRSKRERISAIQQLRNTHVFNSRQQGAITVLVPIDPDSPFFAGCKHKIALVDETEQAFLGYPLANPGAGVIAFPKYAWKRNKVT